MEVNSSLLGSTEPTKLTGLLLTGLSPTELSPTELSPTIPKRKGERDSAVQQPATSLGNRECRDISVPRGDSSDPESMPLLSGARNPRDHSLPARVRDCINTNRCTVLATSTFFTASVVLLVTGAMDTDSSRLYLALGLFSLTLCTLGASIAAYKCNNAVNNNID